MERLFKVTNVYRSDIEGRTPEEARRPKVEITLCYHETFYSSQSGPGIRKQYKLITLLDDAANNCPLQPGSWIVAAVSDVVYDSKTVQGRQSVNSYLDRFVPVTDWNLL